MSRPIGGGCLLMGGIALLRPGRPPLVLGPVAQAQGARNVASGAFSYPAHGSIAATAGVNLRTSGCGNARPANGTAVVASLSLFGGAIAVRRVELDVHGDKPGPGSAVSTLAIDGHPVTAQPGVRVKIASWGYAIALGRQAPATTTAASVEADLTIHLVQPHAGLATGTEVLVAFAGLPPPPTTSAATKRPSTASRPPSVKAQQKKKKKTAQELGQPLTVTPPLGVRHYTFPIVGPSDYIDTYGAFRSDVPGNWHHGDDIFAALGAPVVAVATGTVNRVGWERLGGWRLWVRDRLGNEFYYAHLSGYAPAVLHSNRVRAGEVIGFVGNTGDAFTTAPHVHFEIHPHTLLRLQYNGAVDPTTYLSHWTKLLHARAPKPAHPPLPAGPVRQEARYVFRELLAARHLVKHAPSITQRPQIDLPGGNLFNSNSSAPSGARAMALASGRPHGLSTTTIALFAALGSLLLLALMFFGPAGVRISNRLSREPKEPPAEP